MTPTTVDLAHQVANLHAAVTRDFAVVIVLLGVFSILIVSAIVAARCERS